MRLLRTDLQRTASHWETEGSWEAGRGLYWLEMPAVQHRLNQKVSGQADVNWVRYTLQHHLTGRLPLPRFLSLGCGEGGLERQLASHGAFLACDAFDIAAAAVARARDLAHQAGYDHIHYEVQDANQVQLPTGHYDAVWASGAVHHFKHLEHVFEQVAMALKPDGLFVLNEYVGPNRFQFPPRQRQVIQACHSLLPANYRRLSAAAIEQGSTLRNKGNWRWWLKRAVDKARDGSLPGTVWRRLRRAWDVHSGSCPLKVAPNLPTIRSVQAIDPSEAVRSADIVPLLHQYFDIIELKPLGGSILQFLLADIAGNFQDEAGEQLLNMLFAIEDTLIETGELQSDFAYIVAAPRAWSEKSTGEIP